MKYLLGTLLIGLVMAANAQSTPSKYSVLKTIKVTGDGGWDLLTIDEATSIVYQSHGNVVQAIDVKTGKLVASIPANGSHGIALATELNKGFISNGKDSSVTVFDLKTNEVITKLTVTGRNPDAIIYDAFTKKVFVFNARSENATVIDAQKNSVLATIEVGGKPELPAVDGKGKLYVNLEDKSQVVVINTQSVKVEQHWSAAPGKEATGLAIDNETHRLFMVCDNKMMVVMNADNGKVVTTLPIGEGPDGVAFDPVNKRIYSSNGEGTITVVQEVSGDKYKVLETVKTRKGARTIAIDTKTHHLYLPTAEYGETPAATKETPHPRPTIKPASFVLLEVAPLD